MFEGEEIRFFILFLSLGEKPGLANIHVNIECKTRFAFFKEKNRFYGFPRKACCFTCGEMHANNEGKRGVHGR